MFLFVLTGALAKNQKTKMSNTNQKASTETAVLGGGCFWGVEDILRKLPGVLSIDVGYAGGTFDNPKYEDVKTGKTGHAESVQIVFDPKKLSYQEILDLFFRLHDPTTLNQQGNDKGTQYRSVIFYQSPEQQQIAEATKIRVSNSGKWQQVKHRFRSISIRRLFWMRSLVQMARRSLQPAWMALLACGMRHLGKSRLF
jgi:methionine-S-sulfoxide reductase